MDNTPQQGRLAGMIRTEVRGRVIAREQSVLNRLIAKYRSDELTGEAARAGIALLAELRSFLVDLDRDVRKGQEADAEIVRTGPAMSTQEEEE